MAYGASGLLDLIFALILGLFFALVNGLIAGLIAGLIFGLIGRLTFGMILISPTAGPIAGLTAGLTYGLIFGLTGSPIISRLVLLIRPRTIWLLGGLIAGLTYGLYYGLGRWLLARSVGDRLDNVLIAPSDGLLDVLITVLAATGATWASSYIGVQLRPAWIEFGKVGEYFKVMVQPVLGYALSYLLIVLWFAGCFATAQRWAESQETTAFDGLPPRAGFGEYLYFSLVTVATVGYGDIHPVAGVTKALAGMEIIVGVGWTVVVFGAVIAYLGPRFVEIAERHRQRARADPLAIQLQQVQESVQQIQETVRALQASLVPGPAPRRPWWVFWR